MHKFSNQSLDPFMNHTESGNILAGESDQNASSVKELYYSQFLGDG